MPDVPEQPKQALLRRLSAAKKDRTFRAPLVNEVYRLANPQKRRIDQERATPLTLDEVSDLLDMTLAEAVEDFASDMMAQFTPPHEPWVNHKPTRLLLPEQARAVENQIKQQVELFWSDMESSTYYDAAHECFQDLSAGTMAASRREYGPTQPICYEPVPIAQLLLDEGPDGAADARFSEGKIEKRVFKAQYGQWARSLPAPLAVKFNAAKEEHKFHLVDGVHRVWDRPGKTVWRRVVMLEGEIVYEKFFNEEGSETLYVCRWRSEENSAYGVGPAFKATAAQRVLNELTALVLANMHKIVDPAIAYSDDGAANLEQGVGAGDWVNLGEGFKVEMLESQGRFDVAFFAKNELVQTVRRALFQDRPEQRGDTPPSATQWADETARAQQRYEIPRGKVIREWVVPIVRGHWWQRAKHGLLQPISIGTLAFTLEPVSPQGKARAFEKVSKTERVLGIGAQFLPQEMQVAVDGAATMRNIKDAIGDELTVIRSPEEVQEISQAAAAAAQQQAPSA